MPYPNSPFDETFNPRLITNLHGEQSGPTISNEYCDKILKWLCTFPKITSYRVNTLKSDVGEILNLIRIHCEQISGGENVQVEKHPVLDTVIIIHSEEAINLQKHDKEIVVDADCASAVLRGAHIYAPGVLAMMSGSKIDDEVSIYADITKKCKKGLQKKYEDRQKLFIANGTIKMQRFQLYAENITTSGIAVQVNKTISGCPSLGDKFLPNGTALLQNLPSILCVLALDPKPGETILDMCAAPGNKTTHIAQLMENKGNLIAIDKTSRKITTLKSKCEQFGAKVRILEADATKIIEDNAVLPQNSCDKVLLDAPCSALGKRPQLVNKLSEKEIRSFVPLQRKLLETAVKLLRINGTLVYSTCSITLAENEGNVAWILGKFKCLRLVKPKVALGGPGWPGTTLTKDERECLQRFGPDQDVDSVGFFFACFIKEDVCL